MIALRLPIPGWVHPHVTGFRYCATMRAALLEPLTNIVGTGAKVWSMILAELLLGGDAARERWATSDRSELRRCRHARARLSSSDRHPPPARRRASLRGCLLRAGRVHRCHRRARRAHRSHTRGSSTRSSRPCFRGGFSSPYGNFAQPADGPSVTVQISTTASAAGSDSAPLSPTATGFRCGGDRDRRRRAIKIETKPMG